MSIRWKAMPAHPGYEINASGWVRNGRGYVVASGKAVLLHIGGVRVLLSAPRLREIAAEVFGMPAPAVAPPKRRKPRPPSAAPEAIQAEAEQPEPEQAPEAAGESEHVAEPAQDDPGHVQEEPGQSVPVEPAPSDPEPRQAVKSPRTPYAQPHSTRERMRNFLDPQNVLPLRDPWADGSIEVDNRWALQGVM